MKKCHICKRRIWPWQSQYYSQGTFERHKICHVLQVLESISVLDNKIRDLKERISEQEDYRTLIVEPFREETTRIVQEMISNSPKIKKPSTKTTKGSKKTKVAVKTKRSLTTKQLEEEATKILKKEKKKRK